MNQTNGETPSFLQRLWLSIISMPFWQWGILSLILAALGIWLYGQRDTTPRNPADRVTLDTFLTDLSGDRLPSGKPPVSDLVIYPWNDGVRVVTFKLATLSGNAIEYSNHFLYEISRAGSQPAKISELAASAGVTTQTVHWIGPPIKLMVSLGGGAIIGIGVIWPLLLHQLKSKGLGPKVLQPAESPAVPASPPPAVVTEYIASPQELLSTSHPSTPQNPVVQTAATKPPPVKLSSKPLEAQTPAQTEAEKHYRGEFYPVEHPGEKASGFSLVELLVVIGIIGILIALILPTLSSARRAAQQLQCASNLRNIGLGLVIYLDQNQGVYPPAYLYVGEEIDDGVETPPTASAGYVHWSTYLYSTGTVPQATAFQCPSIDRGGLPPDDTTPDNLDQGQIPGTPGIVDQQVTRLAYTLNEAICPRNKFVLGFQGAVRNYQYVHATQVTNPSGTILGTEWGPQGARIADSGGGFETVSHRPVHGFVGLDGTLDMYLLNPSTGFRQVTSADLDPDPSSSVASTTRLDWVGRNHGQLQGYPDTRRTNFLYVDGHIETKSIYDTLTPFQWGQQFYTLNPHDDMQ